MFGLNLPGEPENEAYDTMKLAVVKNANGTFDLGVGLYVQTERRHYREYQKEFSTYLQALEYMKERAVVYEKTTRFHHIQIKVAYSLGLPEWDCVNSEKLLTQAKAA